MDSKVNVKGDVDVVMDQNVGSITINNYYGDNKVVPAIKPELGRALAELFNVCDRYNQRVVIENISEKYFGTKLFKSLNVEELRVLIGIAQAIADTTNIALIHQAEAASADEDKFAKDFGMRASAPARNALRLLLQENLTKRDVTNAWNSGQLNYEDNNKLSIKVDKRKLWIGNAIFSLGALAALPAFLINPILDLMGVPPGAYMADRLIAIGFCLTICAALFWVSLDHLKPYHSATRVARHIKKVNAQLRKQQR